MACPSCLAGRLPLAVELHSLWSQLSHSATLYTHEPANQTQHLPSLWTSEPHAWVWILTWLVTVQQVPYISKPCFPHSGDGVGEAPQKCVRRYECQCHSGPEEMSFPVLAPELSPPLCLLLATLSSWSQALLKALLTLCSTVPKSQGHTFGVQPSVSTVPGWFKRDAGLWVLASLW